MTALSSTSNTPLLTPIQQTPVDESARHRPLATDSDREALVKLVDDLQKIALKPAVLKNLGALILNNEHNPCGKSLAMLLHPPYEPGTDISCEGSNDLALYDEKKPEPSSLSDGQTAEPTGVNQPVDTERAHRREARRQSRMEAARSLWEQHVPYAAPPLSLIEFAADFRIAPSDKDASDFFLPFKQLAERGIRIPDRIALIFTRKILSLDTFRQIVQAYVTQLPILTPEERAAAEKENKDKVEWTDPTYWKYALSALCSPLAMAILNGGKITPETLLDWTGLKKLKDRLNPDRAIQNSDLPSLYELCKPITVFLANYPPIYYEEPGRDPTPNAALLENPEKLRALADNLVPPGHISYFLKIAHLVDWPAMDQEMDRVAKRNGFWNADIPAKKRALFYDKPSWPNTEQLKCMKETISNMAPYLAINELRAEQHLDTWTVAKAPDGDADIQARLELRPARALFQDWADKQIPAQHQALMGGLMLRGFDEAWAKNIVTTHAEDLSRARELDRARNWDRYDPHSWDMYLYLDDAMKAAVARWMDDKNIAPYAFELLPAIIQSDMSVEQIAKILRLLPSARDADTRSRPSGGMNAEQANPMLHTRKPDLYYQIRKVFMVDSGFHTRQKIRYGLTTPARLLDRALHGSQVDSETLEAEERRLSDVSEWRKKAAETRNHLRCTLRAVETLRNGMPADTPQAIQCEYLADSLQRSIVGLNSVLQPDTDARRAQECHKINDTLTALVADLSFRMANLANPAGARAAELRQFV